MQATILHIDYTNIQCKLTLWLQFRLSRLEDLVIMTTFQILPFWKDLLTWQSGNFPNSLFDKMLLLLQNGSFLKFFTCRTVLSRLNDNFRNLGAMPSINNNNFWMLPLWWIVFISAKEQFFTLTWCSNLAKWQVCEFCHCGEMLSLGKIPFFWILLFIQVVLSWRSDNFP